MALLDRKDEERSKHSLRLRLQSVKRLIKEEEYEEAFNQLCDFAQPIDDFSLQHRYACIFRSIPRGRLDLTPLKVGIVATSTIEHFADIFSFWMAKDGFNLDIYVADFNTMDQSVLNPSSPLYEFAPDIIWLFTNYRDMQVDIPYGGSLDTVESSVQVVIGRFTMLWQALQQNLGAYIIQNNADLPLQRTLGNYEGSICWGQSNFFGISILSLPRKKHLV